MPNKVLITAYDFAPRWGGVATYSQEMALAMNKAGYEVTVLTGLGQSEWDQQIQVIRKPLANSGLLSVPLLFFHLRKLLRIQSYDHIFCSLWLPGAVATHLALRNLGKNTPYSITVHAMEIVHSEENFKKRLRGFLKPLQLKTFQQAKNILCVSHFTKDLLQKNLELKHPGLLVIPNGVNPHNFSALTKPNSTSYPCLLTACRLVPNKGIDQVLRSLPPILSFYPDLQYRICGEGPDQQRLLDMVKNLKLENHVQFLGKTSQDQLVREMQRADLFIMLSRQEKHHVEGFGLVFLEAALCGTPSLGGLSGGIPDAIDDNQTGWLIDPLNTDLISQKLKALLSNPNLLQQTGEAARRITLHSKTWDHRISEMRKQGVLP
jgi:phosphatidylinositol alpha-1,6-mannosyltransferase